MNKQRKAFTLVELIVVITILAILGTIAFISLQGYSKSARDSVRISDMSKIKTSLELFQLNAGKYPEVSGIQEITYSGATAWTQGTFGETTFISVDKLDKIPKDPLIGREYTYSTTNTKQEYQIAGLMEGDELGYLGKKVNAATKTAILKVSGNYNGKMLKINTGGLDYVLAIPSIITSEGFDVKDIADNDKFAYNGYKNLPVSYSGTSYEVFGDGVINLVDSSNLVLFEGQIGDLSKSEESAKRKLFLEKIQGAYTGTLIAGIGEIAEIINTSGDDAIEALSSTLVSNDLGGSIIANGVDGEDGGDDVQALTYKEQGLCDEADITIGEYTIASCNVGTTTPGLTLESYGDFYQFGKNDTSWEEGIYNNDWASPGGTDLGSAKNWGVEESENTTATYLNQNEEDQIMMKGPCPEGYHVPTNAEWLGIISETGLVSLGGAPDLQSALKLPAAGLHHSDGSIYYGEARGHYASSSPKMIWGFQLLFYTGTSFYPSQLEYRSTGVSVRCFKNSQ